MTLNKHINTSKPSTSKIQNKCQQSKHLNKKKCPLPFLQPPLPPFMPPFMPPPLPPFLPPCSNPQSNQPIIINESSSFTTGLGLILFAAIIFYLIYKYYDDHHPHDSSCNITLPDDYKEQLIENLPKDNFVICDKTWLNYCVRRNYQIEHLYYQEPQVEHNLNIVFIDFRNDLSFEYIIRNALIKMEGNCMITFVCGNENHDYIKTMCESLSENIHVIKQNRYIDTVEDYNRMCYDIDYWKKLGGEKILIHQFDAFLLNTNFDDFIDYDYIGGYWRKAIKGTHVGNGGFSLRTKKAMIEILEKYGSESIERYDPDILPEDIFFINSMMKDKKYKIPPDYITQKFAIEGEYHQDKLGCHKFWNQGIYFNDKLL